MSGRSSSAEAATLRRSPTDVAVDIWAYFAQQYPPMQAASVGVSGIASYAIYGQAAGHLQVDGQGIAAAVLVVVLFLQYRLVDDISTTYNRELGGGASIPARPTVLIAGLVASVPLEFLLEPDPSALLVALVALVLMALGSTGLALARRSAALSFAARVTFVEIVPVVIFSYVYFAWRDSTGESLPPAAVMATIGGLIGGFQFWKWSRDLGAEPYEQIYFMSWPRVRWVLVSLTIIVAGFNTLLFLEADLSVLYLVYVIGVCTVFATLAAPRGQLDRSQPPWAALTFPVLLQAGLYVQLLALAV